MNNEKLISCESCPHDNPNVCKQSSLYAYNRVVSSDVIGCNIKLKLVAFVQVECVYHYSAAVETRTAKQLRSGNHLPVGINILEGGTF